MQNNTGALTECRGHLAAAVIAAGIAAILLFIPQTALAINKCKGADGKFTFQDAPCEAGTGGRIEVKPATGDVEGTRATATAPAAGASRPQTEAQRIEAQIAASQRDRRARDLRDPYIPEAIAALELHRRDCEATQASLQASQYAYKQNMYGKVHAAQVASEMAAHAANCQRREAELKDNLAALRKECAQINCGAP
ncbi:MAG: DUF4124 domain-containing protein [Burkholderiaceae bacterium]|nr:DUF4124 domain-containing protein [Burkholderiaceae bacterium]